VVLAAFKAAVRALRGPRRWVRLPLASANLYFFNYLAANSVLIRCLVPIEALRPRFRYIKASEYMDVSVSQMWQPKASTNWGGESSNCI
jgi:hypothetical protein